MAASFRGVQWIVPTDLGISQLYLNGSKLKNIQKWFDPNNMNLCAPLPVHDFGDGRLTLTDGHSRAFLAYRHKTRVPIIYDEDDIVTGDEGQLGRDRLPGRGREDEQLLLRVRRGEPDTPLGV